VSKVSPLVDSLIESIQCLPGVGPKSAQRMVLHLLEREREGGKLLSEALSLALELVGQCRQCRIFSEDELCSICKNEKRDKQVICVVESVSDVFAIEQSNQFRGKYFILHGHLSPIDDIGPEQLGLNQLFLMVRTEEVSEMILATNSTLEGEATAHFIYDSLKDIESLSLTKLAQGVPLGGELEYVDRGTIMHAFSGRVNLKGTM
jgi:recombination protein RecR